MELEQYAPAIALAHPGPCGGDGSGDVLRRGGGEGEKLFASKRHECCALSAGPAHVAYRVGGQEIRDARREMSTSEGFHGVYSARN